MTLLTENSLPDIEGIRIPSYRREEITPGIIHLGVGNFHRAHQAVYIDELLSIDPKWGIVGVSMRSAQTRDRLKPQNFLFTVREREDDQQTGRVIGAILDILVLNEDQQEILSLASGDQISVITLTVTENGYCHTSSGDLDSTHPEIEHDLANPDNPKSVPGLLVAMLRARMRAGGAPMTILSCDNLAGNGEITQSVVTQLAGLKEPELARWITNNVAFPNSMVDRIVPRTSDSDIKDYSSLGITDLGLINTEVFKQWVIEDRFFGQTPNWKSSGVLLVSQVRPFEIMKLQFLNATHTALSYLGLLCGLSYIHEVMEDGLLRAFARNLMDKEITPVAATPDGIDLDAYKKSIMTRFSNNAIAYSTAQVATNGSLKLPERIFPALKAHLENGHAPPRLCMVIAAWLVCISDAKLSGQFSDPILPVSMKESCQGQTELIGDLALNEMLTNKLDVLVQAIREKGCREVLLSL